MGPNSARSCFPNGVREARSTDLLCRTIRNDFPFGMHFTKREAEFRVLERRAARPGNSKRNKDLENTTVRNYFTNGVRDACSPDLLCRTIRNDFPKLYMYVCFLFHSPKTLRAIPCFLRRVTGRSNSVVTPFPQTRACDAPTKYVTFRSK